MQLSRSNASVVPWSPRIPVEIQATSRRDPWSIGERPERVPGCLVVPIVGRYQQAELAMDTARLFRSGRSQAVRLPKDNRFQGSEVAVKHFGNGVLLLPIDDPWATLEAGLASFEPGFTIERQQPDAQQRESIQP